MQIHLILFTFQTDFLNGRKPTLFPCTTALPSVGTTESWKKQNAQGSAPNPSRVKTVAVYLDGAHTGRMPRAVLHVDTAALTHMAGPGVGSVHQVPAVWARLRQTPGFHYVARLILPCSVAQRLRS